MSENSDRWSRCQALAAKLKQQSLAQSTANPQASNQATPSRKDSEKTTP